MITLKNIRKLLFNSLILLLLISGCDDDGTNLIPGTLPAELETSLQRSGQEYVTDGGGGAYHPRQLVVKFVPGTPAGVREDILLNVLLAESYVPCMCGEIIILATFSQAELDAESGLEGKKISGESEDEIEEISYNYYNQMELAVLSPATMNTGDFNSSIASADVVIGMVDAGVDFSQTSGPLFGRLHTTNTDPIDGSDNEGNCLADDFLGWDFANADNDATDDHSHGTHITDIVNKQLFVYDAVVSVDVRTRSAILPVKTHDRYGISTLFNVSCGIIYAADHGADVINTSWGFYALREVGLLETAIEYAFDKNGTIIVASMGNEGQDLSGLKHYPTEFDYPYLFKVGAFDGATEEIASFSNYYPQPAANLMAPGVDIEGAMPEWSATETATKSGTSLSAPYVTAAIAYTMLKCGSKDPAFLKAELEDNFLMENVDFENGEITVRKVIPDQFNACP
ncbi:MAG: S8 family serine peptidase [Bacteroidetes bacterium]|nr:S8 family serine peptidase [Bacteroidota bacterium]